MAVEAVFGATTAWVSDIDPGANRILAHHWPTTPNIGDLTTADYHAIHDTHGPVDIVCGGYPCQPFSVAGHQKGTEDDRHIWPHIANALRVLRPRIAVFENVANHLRLGFDTVLTDLARLGFDAQWCLVRASEIGAPHHRNRLFVVAVASDTDHLGSNGTRAHRRGGGKPEAHRVPPADPGGQGLPFWQVEPDGTQRPPAERSGDQSPAHAEGFGWGEGRPEPAGQQGGPGVAGDGGAAHSVADWGRFGPAVRRWERATGRRAPRATDDRNRLSPAFVEWMMGLSAGLVTGVPGLTRTGQLRSLGNGVVPQQAEAAIRLLAIRAGVSVAPSVTA